MWDDSMPCLSPPAQDKDGNHCRQKRSRNRSPVSKPVFLWVCLSPLVLMVHSREGQSFLCNELISIYAVTVLWRGDWWGSVCWHVFWFFAASLSEDFLLGRPVQGLHCPSDTSSPVSLRVLLSASLFRVAEITETYGLRIWHEMRKQWWN